MNDNISTYLNDHLAGAAAGLAMVDNLIEHLAGTESEHVMRDLRERIASDRDTLRDVMRTLGVEEGTLRRAAAWLGEKAAEIKLRFDDAEGGEFLIFESLEGLSLGIEGKRSLWRALLVASEEDPTLKVADFDSLSREAKAQRKVVERLRLAAARRSLTEK